VHGGVVSFECQEIVGFFFDDMRCDIFLTSHGIECDDAPFEVECVQQFRHCGNLVGLVFDFDLAQNQARL